MTFPNVTALREMAARVTAEYLHQFADMGVEKIALITGDPRIPDSAEDPFGRRCSLAVKAGITMAPRMTLSPTSRSPPHDRPIYNSLKTE